MLELMAAGGLVVGSDTQPVAEVIEDGKNGLLFDFFDHVQIADRVDEVLDHKDRFAAMRERARRTIRERYELESCMRKQIGLLEDLAGGKRPSPAKPLALSARAAASKKPVSGPGTP